MKVNKYLRLIVHLEEMSKNNQNKFDRLKSQANVREILNVKIPVTVVPVVSGRNLAVIAKAAVRNHTLLNNGYDAGQQLIDLQQLAIDNNQ